MEGDQARDQREARRSRGCDRGSCARGHRLLALTSLIVVSRYFCHDHADVLTLDTRVVDAWPGAVVLEQSPFHPGGGGQLPDRGRLGWASGDVAITGFEVADERVWHLLAEPVEPAGMVRLSVDPAFRALQTELHTNAHVLNALVFQVFRGALITGAQLPLPRRRYPQDRQQGPPQPPREDRPRRLDGSPPAAWSPAWQPSCSW